MNWLIRKINGDYDKEEYPFLYWSNDDGWGSKDSATIFTQEEYDTFKDHFDFSEEKAEWIESF